MAKYKNINLRAAADIDKQIEKILRGLGNPKPPLDLRMVRELLKLDFGYYSSTDTGLLQETISRLNVAGKQVLKRPSLLIDAIRKMDLRALYIPDQKRILIDKSQPILKHRWNEAHEIGHSVIPWHAGAMLGDNDSTLVPECHAQIESEANFAAGRLLFLQDLFSECALGYSPDINSVKKLKDIFGNTHTTTFWRCVEVWGERTPVVGMITGHPHHSRRESSFDPKEPCKYFIQSSAFERQFSNVVESDLFEQVASYCSSKRAGPLGQDEILLEDDNGAHHFFVFETFHNNYSALTLGIYLRPSPTSIFISEW